MSEINIASSITNIPINLSLNKYGAVRAPANIGVKLGGCGTTLNKYKPPIKIIPYNIFLFMLFPRAYNT